MKATIFGYRITLEKEPLKGYVSGMDHIRVNWSHHLPSHHMFGAINDEHGRRWSYCRECSYKESIA